MQLFVKPTWQSNWCKNKVGNKSLKWARDYLNQFSCKRDNLCFKSCPFMRRLCQSPKHAHIKVTANPDRCRKAGRIKTDEIYFICHAINLIEFLNTMLCWSCKIDVWAKTNFAIHRTVGRDLVYYYCWFHFHNNFTLNVGTLIAYHSTLRNRYINMYKTCQVCLFLVFKLSVKGAILARK